MLNRWLELLCLLLILGTFFLPGFNADAYANAPGSLGVCNIENPTYYDGANTGLNGTTSPDKYASVYNRIYFGMTTEADTSSPVYAYDENIANQPIYWRVLNTHANDDSVTPALFMLTEYCVIKYQNFNPSNSSTPQTYKNSFIQNYLKNNILPNFFSSSEQQVIMETTKVMGESQKGETAQDVDKIQWYNNGDFYMHGCELNGDKLFLLSAREVTNTQYGFSDYKNTTVNGYNNVRIYLNDTNRQAKNYSISGNSKTYCLLRSASSSDSIGIACVYSLGECCNVCHSDFNSIRFALNIPLSKVLFAQDAASGSTPIVTKSPSSISPLPRTMIKYDPSNDTSLPSVYEEDGTTSIPLGDTPTSLPGAKLTILDSTIHEDFTIPEQRYTGTQGHDIIIPYKHATIGANEYITALIKNSNNEGLLRYTLKKLSTPSDTNGTFTMTLPTGLDNGKYLLIIMNEQCNEAYKTNYAKNYNMHMIVNGNTVTLMSAYTAGACGIHNPEYSADGSLYNRIYFGKNALYWRVLNTTANDKLYTPALFMLTEYCINTMAWNNTAGQTYNGSTIDTTLTNIATTDTTYFEDTEKSVIMSTNNGEITEELADNLSSSDKLYWFRTNNNTSSSIDYYTYGCGLSEKKIFLLSSKEVTNKAYGFDDTARRDELIDDFYKNYTADINRRTKQNSSSSNNAYWWLRSATSFSVNASTIIDTKGYTGINDTQWTNIATRIALNIPLSSVIFAQDASSVSASPTFNIISPLPKSIITHTDGSPTSISSTYLDNQNKPIGAKLTIVDNSRNDFAVDEDLLFCNIGGSVNIHYTGATTGSNEYISAIIKNDNGNHYHARLCSVDESSGEVTMSIPSELPYGEYTLIVYNEKENGAYATNYAGYDIKTLIIIDDVTDPVVTNTYRNNTSTYFKFNASDNTKLCKVTNSNMQNLLTLHGNKTTTNMHCVKQTDIYVEDIFGNRTKLQDVPIDDTPPAVTISYNDGTYTLTVSDNESGVWKITNSDGTVVYRDYSC